MPVYFLKSIGCIEEEVIVAFVGVHMQGAYLLRILQPDFHIFFKQSQLEFRQCNCLCGKIVRDVFILEWDLFRFHLPFEKVVVFSGKKPGW